MARPGDKVDIQYLFNIRRSLLVQWCTLIWDDYGGLALYPTQSGSIPSGEKRAFIIREGLDYSRSDWTHWVRFRPYAASAGRDFAVSKTNRT